MDASRSSNDAVEEPDPSELLASPDSEDRAFGAFLLGSEDYTTDVRATLHRCLGDVSPEVVGYASQSIARHDDVAALSELLPLLENQTGREVNPSAWAAAVLARRADAKLQDQVRRRCCDCGNVGRRRLVASGGVLAVARVRRTKLWTTV